MTYRWVKEDALIRKLDGRMAEAELRKVEKWLRRQRTLPDLVNGRRAAQIAGIHPPYVVKLRENGRLEGVPVEGMAEDSYEVYIREEVEAIAKELQATRDKRAAKRA